jgi:murein DD-endopeptidase MepM/ murein hydrolase activator NlpD
MQIRLILLAIFFISCSTTQKEKASKTAIKNAKRKKVAKVTLIPKKITIPLGTTKLVKYKLPKTLPITKIECIDVGEIVFNQNKRELIFFVGVPYKFTHKKFNCALNVKGRTNTFEFLKVAVSPVQYPTRQLQVPKKHVDLSEANVKRWLKEKARQEEIYGTPKKLAQFTEPFMRPLKSKITSQFGYKRVFNNKKDAWHSGTDLRAAIGTKIPATNRGIVRYAGDLFFNGGTVILDHGLGVYTMYCHLSKVLVQEGEIVPKGSIIAKSGNTGRSTGPHLHWGTKVNGHWIDSLSIVEESTKLVSKPQSQEDTP